MSDHKELFAHFASILPVKDINTSLAFYTEKLGFKMTFSWKDPILYAILLRGGVSIHLTREEEGSPKEAYLYVFVHDVEKVHAEFQSRGVSFLNEMEDRNYHMKDFDVMDPDGNRLTFGQGNE